MPLFKKDPTATDLYIKGLNLLLEGSREEAFACLAQSARTDSEIVEAFFHAGNILRDAGKVERAERVHQELLIRPTLPVEFKNKVKQALIRDYLLMKKYQKAEALCLEVMKSVKSVRLREELLKIYEATEAWEKAIDLKLDVDREKGADDTRMQSLYYLEFGKTLMAADGHAARLRFKEALKKDSRQPWAYILIADTYFAENRVEDALEFWSKLFDALPSKAYLIFEKIERYYYETGDYGEVGRIYRELVEREPENLDALLALSSYLFRRGDRHEAMEVCKKTLEINPGSREAYSELLRQLLENEQGSWELKDAVRGMLKMYPAKKRFHCRFCRTRTETAHWRCLSCGAWNPYDI
ncbi:MAG: tetratricopeptide repeat protein [Fibrobacterota bacterium]